MNENPAQFSEQYFAVNYRNYLRQNPPRKLAFYRQLVEQNLPPGHQVKVLDLGCAFGRFLASLPDSWSKFGIDISEYAIRKAAQSHPRINFAVASAAAAPVRGPFDAIVAFDVIEHVPDLDSVAAFVMRELTVAGVFAFVVPVYDGPLGPVVRALDKDPTHIHKWARKFWLDWARRHFELIEWTGAFRYLLPAGPYIHFPTGTLRSISPAIAVAVRRKH